MAKDRIILAFCIFFYIVKIIEKSLFSEGEIGFIGKITFFLIIFRRDPRLKALESVTAYRQVLFTVHATMN
jgi:hypothetical protein